MNLIEAKNISKNYKQGNSVVHAIHDCNMCIEEGEFIAIMGPSGSGKSTLLNICGGLLQPTSGTILFKERNLGSMNANQLAEYRRKEVGFVYQKYELIPIMTAYENIILPSLLNHQKPAKEYIEHLAEKLHLKDRLYHFPSQLSGGEQQRVAIARAIINHPNIILADEPTGNLDKKNAMEVLLLLETMVRELSITMVMITHDLEIAQRADRILHIQDGTIIE